MPLNAPFRNNAPKQNFKRTEFIDLPVGQHTIRLLHEDATVHDTHFVRGMTLKCLGDDCPICKNNRQIIMEHPTDFRNVPSYSGRRQVAYWNVLDRTPAKVCPNAECQKEVKRDGATFPSVCPKCGASLTTVKATALNKVKVLSKGRELFDMLVMIDSSTLDENETPIGIMNYDVQLMVVGGAKKSTVASALAMSNDKVSVEKENLFDLEKAIVTLTVDEMLDFMRGVQLRDIFAGRKQEPSTQVEQKQISSDIQKSMEDLFSN